MIIWWWRSEILDSDKGRYGDMYKGENGREYIGPVHYREDGFPKTSRPEAVYAHSLLIRREIWPMLKRKHFFRRCSLTMTMLNDSDGNNDNVNDD